MGVAIVEEVFFPRYLMIESAEYRSPLERLRNEWGMLMFGRRGGVIGTSV